MVAITTVAESIHLCREAGVTLFVWGVQGIGKSTCVKDYCKRQAEINGLKYSDIGPFEDDEFGFIDFRCSQIEAADLRGLPDRVDGKTKYLPPFDLPTKGQGILFLDELNRAEDDVLQAAFQLVLDRRIGSYILPEGWSVVVAGNYAEGFNVNNFSDAAFLDRFCHMDLTCGQEYSRDWVEYMQDAHGEVANQVVQFVSLDDDHLTGKSTGTRGFERTPSPRSWDAAARVLKAYENPKYTYSKEAYEAVLRGLIGTLTSAFLNFSVTVKPNDIIEHGIGGRIGKELRKLKRGNMLSVMWGLASKAKKLGEKDDKKREHVLDFLDWLLKENDDKDLAVMMAKQLVEGETSNIGDAVITSPKIAALVESFKKKRGIWGGWIADIRKRPALNDALSKLSWYGDIAGKSDKKKK
jgi:hypothetical protein